MTEANGIRVVLVMNRKGGSGKSTLVKGLASAAIERGETVTVFDTDNSQSTFQWMLNGKDKDRWSERGEVIHSLDETAIIETIDSIRDMPDQEHLVLIDTYGGASEAADALALESDIVIVPSGLSRSDVTETTQTMLWRERLTERVDMPEAVPPAWVIINSIPLRRNEAEEAAIKHLLSTLPALEEPVMRRAAYQRMDLEGLLGPIRDSIPNRAVAAHIVTALEEMEAVLSEIDAVIRAKRQKLEAGNE